MLQVAGDRIRPRCAGQVYQQMEARLRPLRRQIQLGDDVDVTKAKASYERGILKIVAPIAARAKKRRPA